MRPLRRRDLLVVAVGLALGTWLVVRTSYGMLPPMDWWLPVPLGVLALAEGLGARTLSARLAAERDRRPRPGRPAPAAAARPVEPMLVARLAVLAQASAYVGAVFTGCWAGLLLYTVPALGRLSAARGDTLTGVLGVVLAAALAAAALWLEHVCKVPPTRDEEKDEGVRA
jgi:predicted outer membrane lipoprotein